MAALSGYKLICSHSIKVKQPDGSNQPDEDVAKERFSPEGEMLKSIFIKGPSPVISNKGKIILIESDIDEDPDEPQEGGSEEPSGDTPDNGTPEGESGGSDNNSLKRKSYSILEAYYRIRAKRHLFEDAADDLIRQFAGIPMPDMPLPPTPPTDGSPVPGSDEQGGDGENGDSESGEDKSDSEKEDKYKQMKENDTFVYGGKIGVRVFLENEGYTDWLLYINRPALLRIDAIKSALESRKFRDAYDIASKELGTDGIVPVSFKTFISEAAVTGSKGAHCPYIGYSSWGIASGDELTDQEAKKDSIASTLVCLALAPFDEKSSKPGAALFKAQYRILNFGDYEPSKLSKLTSKVADTAKNVASAVIDGDVGKAFKDDENSKKDDTPDLVSQKIEDDLGKSNVSGSSPDTYRNFFKARDWVEKEINAKHLEYDRSRSTNVESLAKDIKSAGAYVTY